MFPSSSLFPGRKSGTAPSSVKVRLRTSLRRRWFCSRVPVAIVDVRFSGSSRIGADVPASLH